MREGSAVGARSARAAQRTHDARGGDQPAGKRSGPHAPAGGHEAVRRGARSDRRDEVEGDTGLPRGRHRSMRGRRQRHRGRRRQARLTMIYIVIALILVALFFDYINGFHDAANSIATVVSTRVLSPGKAVIWAAFFNFVAAFTFGTAVAKTVGSGMIDIKVVTFAVILAGLLGAITWDLITWYYGLPTSSSHALIGGYAGAAVAKAGWLAIIPAGWTKTLLFIVLSPLIGMLLGLSLMTSIFWLYQGMPPSRVDRWFRRLQLLSAAFFSLNHGANDAQKTMCLIAG